MPWESIRILLINWQLLLFYTVIHELHLVCSCNSSYWTTVMATVVVNDVSNYNITLSSSCLNKGHIKYLCLVDSRSVTLQFARTPSSTPTANKTCGSCILSIKKTRKNSKRELVPLCRWSNVTKNETWIPVAQSSVAHEYTLVQMAQK
jgi:hypothetical protein